MGQENSKGVIAFPLLKLFVLSSVIVYLYVFQTVGIRSDISGIVVILVGFSGGVIYYKWVEEHSAGGQLRRRQWIDRLVIGTCVGFLVSILFVLFERVPIPREAILQVLVSFLFGFLVAGLVLQNGILRSDSWGES